jgi:isohexenylglutaconyl-CoA hydratase
VNLPTVTTLLLSLEGGVLRVTLNRPEVRNALNATMVAELNAVFDAVLATPVGEVRVLILRGAGGHFCAGADLKEMMAGGMKPPKPGEADPLVGFNRSFGTMLRKVTSLPAVVITICEGAVLAGGFGFACTSDVALSHVDARFGVPETTRGLPPAQIAPFIVERIGLTQARRLCLTGAQFNGAKACELGIVHETFGDENDLQRRLDELLKQILSCAPVANAVTKEIVINSSRRDLDAVLDDAAQKFAGCVRGSEAPEGISAFMQKRAPKWAPTS